MMHQNTQTKFKRYETKYLLDIRQKDLLIKEIEAYMSLDKYGHITIKNLYFDTENYRLIRRSIEKPDYKEKLRIRGYGDINSDSTVFVEIKKKHDKVVYKRRIPMTYSEAFEWVSKRKELSEKGQIAAEIQYFMEYYGNLEPKLFLSYEREAYYEKNGGDFRVTFDNNVKCSEEELTLVGEARGIQLLDHDKVIMELKCSGGIPVWMTEILSKYKLYKTSFSKYGTAYEKIIFPKLKGGK